MIIHTALIVDDNVNNIQLIERYLKGFGYEYFSTTNPLEIFDIIDYKKPDIILLDLNMPQQHGTETLSLLKANAETTDIPVIVLTAETDEDVLADCFERGASDYITKPVTQVELKARMGSTLKIIQLTRNLVDMEKRATVNAMIVTTNHHFNQPLTVLKGHVELLESFSSLQINEKQQKHFTAIRESIQKIEEIIDQLKKIETIHFKEYTSGVDMIDIDIK